MKISADEFQQLAIECAMDPTKINEALKQRYPDMLHRPSRVLSRLSRFRQKGLLPLDSGNSVSVGEVLKGTSTLYDSTGAIKQQWVKTDLPKQEFLEAFSEAISDIADSIQPLAPINSPSVLLNDNLATLYVSNDVHFGAYVWEEEAESDWSTDIAFTTLRQAYDHLFQHSPNSKIGIICDLGDLTETDDFKNMTPKSGNILDVDSRYPKILRAAYESLIYAVQRALEKHDLVYFYNIPGKHDVSTGVAVSEVIRTAFRDNPRVS